MNEEIPPPDDNADLVGREPPLRWLWMLALSIAIGLLAWGLRTGCSP